MKPSLLFASTLVKFTRCFHCLFFVYLAAGWVRKISHESHDHINSPHELLAPSSSGWFLSTHRCHHSRHLNMWLRPWRRQGRGWFGDPPFCQKHHVWVWEHYRISSKTANTNRKSEIVWWLIILPIILSWKSKWSIMEHLDITEWKPSSHLWFDNHTQGN